ncbi:MAG: four helix bundle protein [Deltaproteobacteria bacterium]|nr:MAG: four helix bundle protein [Deltaproteobacteria bacterium]
MLRIYPVALQMAADAATAANRIGRRDPDLARQLRRAAASVPLNIAEGTGGLGRTRTARYADALGSAYEVRACLDVAAAMTYIAAPAPAATERLRHIIGTLTKLTR